jgi:hypothetical protein
MICPVNGKAGDVHLAYMRGHHSSPVSKGNLEGAIGGAFIVDGRALHDEYLCCPRICDSHVWFCGHHGVGKFDGIGWGDYFWGGHVGSYNCFDIIFRIENSEHTHFGGVRRISDINFS